MASAQEEKEELGRVLQSPQFCKAPRLQKFLRVVCDYYFQGKAEQINEYLIGVEVFGKKADFSAAEDSIVRVEARELRRRLREYYQDGGHHSNIILDLPVGGYSPRFVPSTASVPSNSLIGRFTLLPVWARIVVFIVAVSLVSLGTWKLLRVKSSKSGEPTGTSAAAGASVRPLTAFWNRFLAPGDSTVIVLSNPPVFRFVGGGDPPQVRSKAIRVPPSGDLMDSLANEIQARNGLLLTSDLDQYTGIGEAMALYSIASTLKIGDGKLLVKQSRTLSADDLKHHNLVLLGGSAVNLWTVKLGQTLDFLGEQGSISNLRPRDGELPKYLISAFDPKTGKLTNDYAVIAVQRSSATGHWVLLLFGGHSEGTQAAAEAMTDETFMEDLLRKMTPPDGRAAAFPQNFQVLLSVKVDNGIPERPGYVIHHVP